MILIPRPSSINQLVICFCSLSNICLYAQLSDKILEHTAQKLGSELYRITKAASGHAEIQQTFRDMGISVEKVKQLKSLTDIAHNVSTMLGNKVAAVKRLVENAEEITMAYRSIPGLNMTYYNAKLMDNNMSGFPQMEFVRDARFLNENINLTASTIHVPTNIYNRAPDVLNGINWSSQLDPIFRRNFQDDPTLKSQYFGSSEGFLRLFPGVKWINPEPDRPDMYDCRLTNWYIRASSSPKDMVILVDFSGSMTGIRAAIARATVREILNTLHDDDFFNILTMKEWPYWLLECANKTLLQASESTKRKLIDLMGTVDTENIAEFSEAFTVAFQTLDTATYTNAASCNKVIMLITDGAPETFEDLLNELNAEKRVRIFTYVIGREVTAFEEMKSIACNNRGFITHITTLADVRDKVEVYTRVVARPMVLSQNHTNIWTNPYWHIRMYTSILSQPIGLSVIERPKNMVSWTFHDNDNFIGMVLTVAQPVFNRSEEALRKGSLIGVVGIDVPINDIKRLMEPEQWTVGSYIFGTNHNGHVLFHPYWRLTTSKTAQPRHSYNEIDLAKVEFPVRGEQSETLDGEFNLPLRRHMIDQESGTLTMNVLRQLDERNRVYERQYVYHYAGISDTQLSIGLAHPLIPGLLSSELTRPVGWLDIGQFDGSAFLTDNNDTQLRLHPEWAYCNITPISGQDLFHHLYSGFKSYSLDETEDSSRLAPVVCDSALVKSLLFDLKATQVAVDSWQEPSDIQRQYGIETAFVITRAGATRWYDFPPPFTVDSSTVDDNELRVIRVRDVDDEEDEEEEDEQTDNDGEGKADVVYEEPESISLDSANSTVNIGHFFESRTKAVDESFYERTVMGGSELTVTVGLSKGPGFGELSSFMASVPVFAGGDDGKEKAVPIAVSGIFMKIKRLRELLMELSQESCQGASDCFACHSPSVGCFLLDESGYVVASTSPGEYRGKFFGILHGEVMQAMVKEKIYTRYKLRHYQGLCQPILGSRSRSAAFQLRTWLAFLFSGIRLLTTQILTIISSLWWPTLAREPEHYWFEVSVEKTDASNKTTHRPLKMQPFLAGPPKPCDMRYHLYHSNWTGLRHVMSIQCRSNCTKNVGVYRVSTTNMLLIAMDKLKACHCREGAFSTAPEEVKYSTNQTCKKMQMVHYRRRPRDCFPFHKDEDASACTSRGWLVTITVKLVVVSVSFLLYSEFLL